jgi:hypothetical protein
MEEPAVLAVTRDGVNVSAITLPRVMRRSPRQTSMQMPDLSTEEGRKRVSRRDVVITVMGEMSDALRAEFDDLRIVVEHGVTRIHVAAADPPALHGVLHRLEAFGLDLLDVHLGPEPPQT